MSNSQTRHRTACKLVDILQTGVSCSVHGRPARTPGGGYKVHRLTRHDDSFISSPVNMPGVSEPSVRTPSEAQEALESEDGCTGHRSQAREEISVQEFSLCPQAENQ